MATFIEPPNYYLPAVAAASEAAEQLALVGVSTALLPFMAVKSLPFTVTDAGPASVPFCAKVSANGVVPFFSAIVAAPPLFETS